MRLSVRTLLKPSKSLSKIAAAFGEEGSFPDTKTAYTSDPPAIDKDILFQIHVHNDSNAQCTDICGNEQ